MIQSETCDIAILGGGLSGCLIALALSQKQPSQSVKLIEPGTRLGGNHVWSFFDTDVATEHRWLVEPLICHRWSRYDVAFPAHNRTLQAPYNSIESERLDKVVRERLPKDSVIEASVEHIDGHLVRISDDRIIKARHIVDARGLGDLSTLQLGWQKFVGLEVRVPGGHGLQHPIIMDATVEQIDGYRFVYCLPFDAETVFIEDTYYSDTPDLDVPAVRERIISYAAARGWQTNGGGREETGVLPVVTGGDFNAYWASTGEGLTKAGLRAGMFNATTGYSLPAAVRLAASIAETLPHEGGNKRAARIDWRAQGYFRLLGKMLFHATKPELRYRIFERFYRLSPGLISRFYAGRLTWADKARILSGKPPVPIYNAIRAILRNPS